MAEKSPVIFLVWTTNIPRRGRAMHAFLSEVEAHQFAANTLNEFARQLEFPECCMPDDWRGLLCALRRWFGPQIEVSVQPVASSGFTPTTDLRNS